MVIIPEEEVPAAGIQAAATPEEVILAGIREGLGVEVHIQAGGRAEGHNMAGGTSRIIRECSRFCDRPSR